MTDILPVRTLREWREDVFFQTQIEFAKRIGVSVSTLSMWESGKRKPQITKRRWIAKALELQPQQIRIGA